MSFSWNISPRYKPAIARPETLKRLLDALRRRPSELLVEHGQETLELARRHRLSNVRVFGPVVRGEDTPASDLDLLVDAEPGASLFDLISTSPFHGGS